MRVAEPPFGPGGFCLVTVTNFMYVGYVMVLSNAEKQRRYRTKMRRYKEFAMQIVFTIYDLKSESYGPLGTGRTLGEISRMLMQTCADPNTTMSKYPEDFVLIELGSYDMVSGKIDVLDPYRSHGNCVQFMPSGVPNMEVLRNGAAQRDETPVQSGASSEHSEEPV